jgi:hypothetical protein
MWPTLALHGITGDSAGNYHHMHKKSTGGMGFRRELLAHRRGIHPRKGIPTGITILFTQSQAGKIKMSGKSFEQFQDQQIQIPYTVKVTMPTIFVKFNCKDLFKIKNKPDPALLGTSYLSN